MKVKFDLEWFRNLTDEELCDIAYLEAVHIESTTSYQVKDLLVALLERVKRGTKDDN